MKAERFIPVGIFLAVALPLLWLLNALNLGGEYRSWLAIAVGAIVTGYSLTRQARKAAGTATSGEQA